MADRKFKHKLLEACKLIVEHKYETLRAEYRLYQESAANETKSTAGDKHDTARSMMQMEQEKLGVQLKELQNHQKILASIEEQSGEKKSLHSGDLIVTDQGIFYIAVPLGKIEVDGKEVFVISMQSPLAKLMSGKAKNSTFGFNGKTYNIQEIA